MDSSNGGCMQQSRYHNCAGDQRAASPDQGEMDSEGHWRGRPLKKGTQGKLKDLRKAIGRVEKKKAIYLNLMPGIFFIEWHMSYHIGLKEKKVYVMSFKKF